MAELIEYDRKLNWLRLVAAFNLKKKKKNRFARKKVHVLKSIKSQELIFLY
jgi:hypothetical protein